MEYRQLQDSNLNVIAQGIAETDNDKFKLIDGLIYKKSPDKPRFVVPELMVNNIIRVYHDNMTHCGFKKTLLGNQLLVSGSAQKNKKLCR